MLKKKPFSALTMESFRLLTFHESVLNRKFKRRKLRSCICSVVELPLLGRSVYDIQPGPIYHLFAWQDGLQRAS